MNSDIPEKHVQERTVLTLNHPENAVDFRIRNLPGMAGSSLRSTCEPSPRRSLNDLNRIDRPIPFALLRNDNRSKGSQPDDVPVDVQHFRFEKRCAKQRDRRRSWSHSRPPLSARARINPNSGETHHSTLARINPVE